MIWAPGDTVTSVIPASMFQETKLSVSIFHNTSQISVVLGYAVTAGHFSSPTAIDVAAGAPQDNGGGKVRDRNLG